MGRFYKKKESINLTFFHIYFRPLFVFFLNKTQEEKGEKEPGFFTVFYDGTGPFDISKRIQPNLRLQPAVQDRCFLPMTYWMRFAP